jgi:lysophospholipase L1-like esterase
MKLEGKKINFLGDSITQAHALENVEDAYWNVVKKECGLAEARGYGLGGTRIARQSEQGSKWGMEHWNLDFCQRFPEMDDDADVVVVFGGTNDYGHGDAPMGNMSDREPNTFYGACHYLFEGLIKKYPNAEIVVMTPLHRMNEENDVNEMGMTKNTHLCDYVDVIKEVAEYYALPVLDLWSVSGIQPNVESNRLALAPDGLHPNVAGHRRIASRLEGFLKAL